MKRSISFLVLLLFIYSIKAQPPFELSVNVYRLPYENGKNFAVLQDQYTHSPLGRFDLRASGTDDCNSHKIVAAAAGVVRMVVDNNTQSCTTCGANNNYVWISHANNEWTKYTHFKQNSVTVSVNDTICAGTVLGYECYIGSTSPAQYRHLHFEVRRPNNPASPVIDPAGGFMNAGDGAHLIPVINTMSKHFMEQNDNLVASASTTCTNTNVIVPAVSSGFEDIKVYMASGTIVNNTNSISFSSGSNGLFHAGQSVTLTPGFTAMSGSYFHARIGNCSTTPSPGGCN